MCFSRQCSYMSGYHNEVGTLILGTKLLIVLGHDTLQSGIYFQTFHKNILPPSSACKASTLLCSALCGLLLPSK